MKGELIIITILFSLMINAKKTNAQYTYDSVSFESPASKIIIDTTNNNIWQIGRPNKRFFNSAYSGSKAILTDSVYNYKLNDTSSFIYVIRNPYTQTCYTSMEFWHKYDMDTLTDIGIIDASYDGGNSWILVSDTNEVLPVGAYFWWDNDYHEFNGNQTIHPLITTGKSNGWIKSKFNWQWWLAVKSDTIIYPLDSLMIRFTFISDSIETNKEGWMIDEILTSSAEYELCSGIEEKAAINNIHVYPIPFSLKATVRSEKVFTNSIMLIYNSFGQKVKQIENISGQTFTLYRYNLPSGLYYLILKEDNKILINKEIIIID